MRVLELHYCINRQRHHTQHIPALWYDVICYTHSTRTYGFVHNILYLLIMCIVIMAIKVSY